MDAVGRAFDEEFGELFFGFGGGGVRRCRLAEAEVVFGAAEEAVALQAEEEEEDGGAGPWPSLAWRSLRRVASSLMPSGTSRQAMTLVLWPVALATFSMRPKKAGVGGGAVEDVEDGSGLASTGCVVGGDGGDHRGEDGDGGFLGLSDHEDVFATEPAEVDGGRFLDGDGFADVRGDGGRRRRGRGRCFPRSCMRARSFCG